MSHIDRQAARIHELETALEQERAGAAVLRADVAVLKKRIRNVPPLLTGLEIKEWAEKTIADDHPGAGVMEVVRAAQNLEPHVDKLICYASTITEHPVNGLVKDFCEALAALNGDRDADR